MTTTEEAIKTLKENCCAMCAYGSQNMDSCDIRGCDNRDAIKALEQEPCEDAISRRVVIDTLDAAEKFLDEDRTVERYKDMLTEAYEVLPPVDPQPKTDNLDKIRAEIADSAKRCMNDTRAEGIYMALKIIDRYMAESEIENDSKRT